MDVKYFGNGGTAIVIGEGQTRQVDDGRGNVTEVDTVRVVVLDPSWIEEVEADQLVDERPELHPDTGRPLSETEDPATQVGRGGPSYSELEAEVARLRAANPDYNPTQDRSGSTQTAADQQPGSGAPATVTSITEAPAAPAEPTPAAAAATPDTPEGYTVNDDGTYTRQADGVRGTIDWDAQTFHPQA